MTNSLLALGVFFVALEGGVVVGDSSGNVCLLGGTTSFGIPRHLYQAQHRALLLHGYDTHAAKTRTQCAASCLQDSRCLSSNFCPNAETSCELNDSTREKNEEDFVEMESCFYFDENAETQLLYGNSGKASPVTSTSMQTTLGANTVSSPSYCQGHTASGVYTLSAPGSAYDGRDVYCDSDTDSGGWLVFQRRVDGSTDFYRSRQSYEDGFGNVTGNFWLGNGLVHNVTSTGQWQLRVDLTDWEGGVVYAQYDVFSLGAGPGFRLNVGSYSGNAGDSMAFHDNQDFTTKDYDRDGAGSGNCAQWLYGAWWYVFCHRSALNGRYLVGGGRTERDQGLQWTAWKGHEYSLKTTEMKIRPLTST